MNAIEWMVVFWVVCSIGLIGLIIWRIIVIGQQIKLIDKRQKSPPPP